jgi:hypothetical protein
MYLNSRYQQQQPYQPLGYHQKKGELMMISKTMYDNQEQRKISDDENI